jgi:hydroxymethylbilane synthase
MNTNSQSKLRIATRKSALALWQAHYVKNRILEHFPNLEIELVPVTTSGDKIVDVSLSKVGGKGLFVKELEDKLLKGEADIAVHSMKDVPAELPEGLKIGCILEREDPRDAFLSVHYDSIAALPKSAKIGTSSLRRQAQMTRLRDNVELLSLRGNVDTRIRKLEAGEFDAIILAYAGLKRLNLLDYVRTILEPEMMLSGVGQGALGIE